MTEPIRNIGFTAATGFGHEEEEYLTKNAVDFHILESGQFSALSDVWLDVIWQQHVLYWPPKDHSDSGLKEHRKHVQHALRWLYNTLDRETQEQKLAHAATREPKVLPPGPSESQLRTAQQTIAQVRQQIKIFHPPSREQIAKSMALQAAKFGVRARLRQLKEAEECRKRRLARSKYIRTLYKRPQET